MPVCRFWQQGNCRFGDSCRFDHPGSNRQQQQQQPLPSRNDNRFAPLNNPAQGRGGGQGGGQGGGRGGQPRRDDKNQPLHGLDLDVIRVDLSTERPIWILSSYGPGRQAPAQLFGGHPREQSFEEIRLRHYELSAEGKQQQALEEAQVLYNSAEEQIKSTLRDVNGAVRYIVDAEKQHPNRLDICRSLNDGVAQVPGRNTNTGPSTTPSFGQSPTPTLGQSSQPAPTANPFAAAAQAAFGQPSTLGSAGSIPSGPDFGDQSKPANPFGTAPNSSNPFGGNPTSNPPFGQAASSSNPFGSTPASSNPFGQTAGPPAANPFAQARERLAVPNETTATPTPSFGTSSLGASGFGSAQQQSQPQPSGFGGATIGFAPAAPASSGGFGAHSTISHQTQLQNASVQKNSSGKVTSWGNRPVSYIDDVPCFRRPDGGWERIWFPDAPTNAVKEEELPLELYTSSIEEDYKYLAANKSFKDGIIPDLPPKKEWTSWNF